MGFFVVSSSLVDTFGFVKEIKMPRKRFVWNATACDAKIRIQRMIMELKRLSKASSFAPSAPPS